MLQMIRPCDFTLFTQRVMKRSAETETLQSGEKAELESQSV